VSVGDNGGTHNYAHVLRIREGKEKKKKRKRKTIVRLSALFVVHYSIYIHTLPLAAFAAANVVADCCDVKSCSRTSTSTSVSLWWLLSPALRSGLSSGCIVCADRSLVADRRDAAREERIPIPLAPLDPLLAVELGAPSRYPIRFDSSWRVACEVLLYSAEEGIGRISSHLPIARPIAHLSSLLTFFTLHCC